MPIWILVLLSKAGTFKPFSHPKFRIQWKLRYESAQTISVHMPYASSECSDDPAQTHSLLRAFTTRTPKVPGRVQDGRLVSTCLPGINCTVYKHVCCSCADPENLARGGPTLTTFVYVLFFMSGERI